MKIYVIEDTKNGKQEIQTRTKGITITRQERLKEQGKIITQVIEIDERFIALMKNFKNNT